MEKTLSVIIPVYNTEKYLKRALESVLGQTISVHEIICVDDGSTDRSMDILNAYAKKDGRIKVIHKENGGPASARKAGVAIASGTYLTFVDSDDFVEPDMYEEMMSLACRYHADIVTSGFIRDYGNSITVNHEKMKAGVYTGEQLKTEVLGSLIDTDSFYRMGISDSLCNKIFRQDKLKPVQMAMDERIFMWEDDAVVFSCLFRCDTLVVSGKSYYHYCVRETGSLMGTERTGHLDESMDILLRYLEKEFRDADRQGLNLMRQFQIMKTSFLMMKCASKVLSYGNGILYPFGKVNKEDRLLLYGAGKLGVELKAYLEAQGFSVVGWADKSANRPGVIRPDEIREADFDYVSITVLIADVVEHIREDLKKLGVPDEKVLFVDAKLIR
jgi:Glycosyltransferases involved in cell wall biogenesis